MLNQLEIIGESSSDYELIFTAGVVGSDFLSDKSLVVLVQCDTFDETIDLATLREDLNLALPVENGLLSIGAHVVELILVDEEFG